MIKKSTTIYLFIAGILLVGFVGWYAYSLRTQPEAVHAVFDGQRAYADVQTQVAFGPRIPGSEGHAKIQRWMNQELVEAGWQVEIQESEVLGTSREKHCCQAKR